MFLFRRIDFEAIKTAVVESVQQALNSFKNQEKDALTLTETINKLKKELTTVKEELESLKSKKKIELMELETLVKCKEEKSKIELERQSVALEKQFNTKEMELLKSHHQKTIELINDTKKEFSDLYKNIIDRLPNVNMEIKKGSR